MLFPSDDHHPGSLARGGFVQKLFTQTFAAAKAEPHPVAGGESVLEGHFEVGNTRTPVLKDEFETDAAADAHLLDGHSAALAMIESITRELTGSRHQFGLVDESEFQFNRPLPYALPRQDHVVRGLQRERVTLHLAHRRSPGGIRRPLRRAVPCLLLRSMRFVRRATTCQVPPG